MRIKTNELQKLTSVQGTDTILVDGAAGTGQVPFSTAAQFFGQELVKPGNAVGAAFENKAAVDFGNLPHPQAALYNLGARPEKNLLDNSRWDRLENIINQRNQLEYTGAGYTIDRWVTLEGGKVVVTDSGLEMSSENSPQSRTNFAQILEHKLADDGIYTLSVLYNGNQLATRSGQKALNETAPINGFGYARFYDTNRGSIVEFVCNTENFEAVINAVKLEPGPVQTLARQDASGNWVLNDPPPDPALELLKCQRYQFSVITDYKIGNFPALGMGIARSAMY